MAVAMMAPSHGEPDVHPFFQPQRGLPPLDVEVTHVLRSNTLSGIVTQGEDVAAAHDGPRKRRRTGSSDDSESGFVQHPTWETQLQLAADASHPIGSGPPQISELNDDGNEQQWHTRKSGESLKPVQNGENGSSQSSPRTPDEPPNTSQDAVDTRPAAVDYTASAPQKMMMVRLDGKLASPKARGEKTALLGRNALQPAQEKPHTIKSTPSKRILRIRSDGKLTSPKAQHASDEMATKHGKRRSPGTKSTLLAIMPYGEDRAEWKSKGDLIESILSGTTRHTYSNRMKSLESSKPTHPFFLGGASQSKLNKSEKTLYSTSSETPEINSNTDTKRISPRKTRVNSKPPQTNAPSDVIPSRGFPMFGTDHAKVTRFPGAQDPLWPPLDFGSIDDQSPKDLARISDHDDFPMHGRKLKDVQIDILPDEDILHYYKDLFRTDLSRAKTGFQRISKANCQFRRPRRRLLTSDELQAKLSERLSEDKLSPGVEAAGQKSSHRYGPPLSESQTHDPHPAVSGAKDLVKTSRSAFDEFRCESKDWVHKYAPKSAKHVLQQGREALILRAWLEQSTVTSTDVKTEGSKLGDNGAFAKGSTPRSRRKRKKRSDDMDDFLVSSDEEVGFLDAIPDPEHLSNEAWNLKSTVVRSETTNKHGRLLNAILISGPHGCGKTAAVYATANELGFEVFELNAGHRRSGKDILDRVGDMTRNHLVKHPEREEASAHEQHLSDVERVDEKLESDLKSGRQGTMQAFLKPKSSKVPITPSASNKAKDKSPKKKSTAKSKDDKPEQANVSRVKSQKQSLILFEEVDILFEEDKMFWATVLDLIHKSKRPVILTCSDESILPLGEIPLHGVLRFEPPPESLAVDYMLLLASSEGHLLNRESVSSLYRFKNSDLRASIAELNFYCQIGIGDTKGGLEWMLIDQANQPPLDQASLKRVISEDTYCTGMGWLGGEAHDSPEARNIMDVAEINCQIWNGCNIDVTASHTEPWVTRQSSGEVTSQAPIMQQLQRMDACCEAGSAADLFPSQSGRDGNAEILDTTQPSLNSAVCDQYTDRPMLIQADSLSDPTGISSRLMLTLRTLADMQYCYGLGSIEGLPDIFTHLLTAMEEKRASGCTSTITQNPAFETLAHDPKPSLGTPKGPFISSFDGTRQTIAEDLAPCARSIVSYDLRLEEQRQQLDWLLSQPGANSGRTRKTRASRAALEGGDKANTRRERWFPKNTNFNAILASGGEGWQEVLLKRMHQLETIMNETDEGNGSPESDDLNRGQTEPESTTNLL